MTWARFKHCFYAAEMAAASRLRENLRNSPTELSDANLSQDRKSMTPIAIKVTDVGKTYRIGAKLEKYKTLRDSLSRAVTVPYRALRQKLSPGACHRSRSSQETFRALQNVSFEVAQGEIVGIVGRNGAGKSTLLKILSRITEPDQGSIEYFGRISSLLEVGTGFHMELTGRENVYLNGAILGMRKNEIDRKFDEIVDFAEMERFIDTPVKHYSSGMQLRLAFAVAAHLEPEILLIDEVLAVGDARFQKKCLSKMKDVGQHGRTVLFVSHNMPAVTRLCNRCLLLEGGRLVKDGPAHEVVSAYLHADSGTTAAREWPDSKTAPAGDIACLRAVKVRDPGGEICEAIDIRKPVSIEMTFEVIRDGAILLPFFMFSNEEDVLAFATNDLDPHWRGRPRPRGEYKSSVRIPGNLLSEGTLFVGAGITSEGQIVQFYEPDAVAFHVIDSLDGDSARGDYGGQMDGVVRPMLQWSTQFIATNPRVTRLRASQ
jgi:homopolymeric O-antigen transport system ATP-binding protein